MNSKTDNVSQDNIRGQTAPEAFGVAGPEPQTAQIWAKQTSTLSKSKRFTSFAR